MSELISVIIPVFNAGEYIGDCLRRLMDSPYKELEILVVDDGSTDDSRAVCTALGALDSRIRLLRQRNMGVSAARNLGIARARGRYLMFADADDLPDGSVLFRAVAEMEHARLVCWNICCRYGEGTVKEPPLPLERSTGEALYAGAIAPDGTCGRYFRACWGKLFDGEIIRKQDIRFDETLYIGEDAVFLLEYLQHAGEVRFLQEYGYTYRKTDTSAVYRQKPDLLEQSLHQAERIEEFVSCHDNPGLRTAQTALYWNIFGKLLQNGGKDAQRWLRVMKPKLFAAGVLKGRMSRLCRLQYCLGRYLPSKVLCGLTAAVLDRRKRRERHG